MSLVFQWDKDKANSNARKHGVSFLEAAWAFADPFSLTIPDPDHSIGEERFILLGETPGGRLLVVVHTETDDTIRIVSARPATRAERRHYEEE